MSVLVVPFRAIVNVLPITTLGCFVFGVLLAPEALIREETIMKNAPKSAGQAAVSQTDRTAKRFAFPVAEIISLRTVGEPETIGMKLRWNTGQIEEVLFDSAELNGPEIRSA